MMRDNETLKDTIRENFQVDSNSFTGGVENGFTHNGGRTKIKYLVQWLEIFKQFNIRNVQFQTKPEKNPIQYLDHKMYFTAGPEGKEYNVYARWDLKRGEVENCIHREEGEPVSAGVFLGWLLQSIGLPYDLVEDTWEYTQSEIRALFRNYLFKKGMEQLNQIFKKNLDIQTVKAVLGSEGERLYEVELKLKKTKYELKVDYEGRFGTAILSKWTEGDISYEICRKMFSQLEKDFKELGFQETPRAAFKIICEALFSEIKEKYKTTKEYQMKQKFTTKPIIDF